MFDKKAYMKEYTKKHYAANKELYKERAKQWAVDNKIGRQRIARVYAKKQGNKLTRRKRRLKEELIGIFNGVCADCKGTFPPCAFDFHHLDPKTKDFSVAIALAFSRERLLTEVKKCIMLCANCHRIRHATTRLSAET